MQDVGKLVIISGPSGAGKSTVVKQLIARCPLPLVLSVSATTRKPRPGERNGVEYHFLSHEEFARRKEAGEFLEWKEVYRQGDWYGTLSAEVTAGLRAGKWVILEIDVEGAMSVVAQQPDTLTIFLHPGSEAELEARLRQRGTETEERIQRRLATARRELESRKLYQYEVVNDTVDQAVERICRILQTQGANGPCMTS